MTSDAIPSDTTRRGFLKGTVGATAVGAGMSGFAESAAAQSDSDLAAWFENTDNYDGVTDRTGKDEVTVAVGAEGNGGGFAFDPPAIRIDPGTTVVWEWTGNGGSHNVAATDGAFESETVGEEGHTFEFTAEETGVFRYACTPHEAMGMKGALVVGDAEVGAAAAGSSGTKISPEVAAVGGSIVLGLLSPVVFALVLFRRGEGTGADAAVKRPRQPSQ